jgi:hypothetical protein
MIESFLPDLDLDADADFTPHADMDLHADGAAHPGPDHPDALSRGIATQALGWLRIGQVPFLVVLVVFLTIFGLEGLLIQALYRSVTGQLLPGAVASALSLLGSAPLVRWTTGGLAKVMPRDETEVVSERSFIGKTAVITLGCARKKHPAQAKLRDRYGTTHYVMVEPDLEEDEFLQGEKVLIVRQTGCGYTAIHQSLAVLEETDT